MLTFRERWVFHRDNFNYMHTINDDLQGVSCKFKDFYYKIYKSIYVLKAEKSNAKHLVLAFYGKFT